MKRLFDFLFFVATLLVTSCGDSFDYEYSDYHPYFNFHNDTHQDAVLSTALNPQAPGVFCIIKYAYVSGRYSFSFENNQGLKSSSPVWFDAIDLKLESWRHVGMNNGLIVGYGNLDNPAVFFAYDLQCPNCYHPDAIPQRPYELKINGTGIATCSNCKRSYNLNTGGNIVTGQPGRKLIRYRGTSTGPFGILVVN